MFLTGNEVGDVKMTKNVPFILDSRLNNSNSTSPSVTSSLMIRSLDVLVFKETDESSTSGNLLTIIYQHVSYGKGS